MNGTATDRESEMLEPDPDDKAIQAADFLKRSSNEQMQKSTPVERREERRDLAERADGLEMRRLQEEGEERAEPSVF